MASRTKTRALRQRRHRDQERQGRGRHPASATPVAALSGQGLLVTMTMPIAMPAAPTLCGSGRLNARELRRRKHLDGRRNNRPPRPGRPRQTVAPTLRDGGDWALVTWSESSMAMCRPSYWPTKAAAEDAAAAYRYEGRPYSVVDVSRSERIASTETVIRETTRPILEHPYPAERLNNDPRRVTVTYDGWRRASARPVSSSFHQ